MRKRSTNGRIATARRRIVVVSTRWAARAGAGSPPPGAPGCSSTSGATGRGGAYGAGPCAEDAQAGGRSLPGEPLGGALEALVLGEAQGQLLGRALGVELLLVLGVGIDEQARLELAQRRDEHEELRERLEIDLLGALQLREVGQHDVDDRHLDELELLAQDEGEQQVERPRERVEVEVELENGSVHTRIVATTPDACGYGRHLGSDPAWRGLTPGGGARRAVR